MTELPRHITREQLADLLARETSALAPALEAWWQRHRVDPFVGVANGVPHYVVAQDGDRVLFFADDEDEFATGQLRANAIYGYGLIGDLRDAIRMQASA